MTAERAVTAERNQDLTARVASSRALAGADRRPQVLLIDDQPNQVLPWLERVLADFCLIPVSNTEELQRVLSGRAAERLPAGGFRPMAALIDLGAVESGVRVMTILRDHPLVVERRRVGRDTEYPAVLVGDPLLALAAGLATYVLVVEAVRHPRQGHGSFDWSSVRRRRGPVRHY